tara:strand:- start:115 stop:561 length:447 start_codon:yes stop_codon:yes gene_type:complete
MHDDHKVDPVRWKKTFLSDITAIWLIVTLKNGSEHFVKNTNDWHLAKKECEESDTFVDKMSLQFKSHKERIGIDDVDGVYFAKSIIGILGSDSKQTITIGKIKDGVAHKKMWLVPELIVEKEYKDDESSCFEESIIYDKTKENRKEQV